MYFFKCLGNDLNISYSWRWPICHVSWVVEYFSWKYYRSKSCHNWSDSHGISKTYTFSDLYCFFLRFFSWFWIMNFSLNVQWVNNTNTYSDMKICSISSECIRTHCVRHKFSSAKGKGYGWLPPKWSPIFQEDAGYSTKA